MNKPKFNPNKPFDVVKPKFDPNKPFDEVGSTPQPEAIPEDPSQLEAGLRGAAQGASLGFADEATGALEALKDKLMGEKAGVGELYTKHRDESRANYKKAQEAHPITYGASELGGALLTPGIGEAKGALQLAKQGAVLGGLSGLGNAEGSVGEQAKQTALGGATGGVLGGVLGKITNNPELKAKMVAKSMGLRTPELRAIEKQTRKPATEVLNQILESPLYDGLVNNGKTIAEKAEGLKNTGWDKMADTFNVLDKEGKGVNPANIIQEYQNKVNPLLSEPIHSNLKSPHIDNLMTITNPNRALVNGKLPYGKAQELNNVFAPSFKGGIATQEEAGKNFLQQQAKRSISNEIQNQAQIDALDLLNQGKVNPEFLEQLKQGKQEYGLGALTSDILNTANSRNQGNNMVSPSSKALGIGGLVHYGLNPKALALAVGHHLGTSQSAFGAYAKGLKAASSPATIKGAVNTSEKVREWLRQKEDKSGVE